MHGNKESTCDGIQPHSQALKCVRRGQFNRMNPVLNLNKNIARILKGKLPNLDYFNI